MNYFFKTIFILFFSIFFLYTNSTAYAVTIEDRKFLPEAALTTPPKSQGSSGACWAFAGIATLEAFLAKNKMFSQSLSEQHLIDWCSKKAGQAGWHIGLQAGASSFPVIGYLMSGNGPQYESAFPFRKPIPSCQKSFPGIRVSGIRYLPIDTKNPKKNINDIKQAVLDYGAVASGYGTISSGHAICIVGWNDDISSWYIKDSLSSSYRFLPYSTPGLLSSCLNYSITSIEKIDPLEKIYQHDYFSDSTDFVWTTSHQIIEFANVFTFEENQQLTAVSFASSCAGIKYTLKYAPFVMDRIDTSKEHQIDIAEGITPYSGYITIKAKEKIKCPKGKGAIIICIDNTSNKSFATIGAQSDFLSLTTDQVYGNSFVIADGKTIDILSSSRVKSEKTSALCIKAITEPYV